MPVLFNIIYIVINLNNKGAVGIPTAPHHVLRLFSYISKYSAVYIEYMSVYKVGCVG